MKRKVLLLLAVFAMAFSANAQFTVISITGEAVGGWGNGHDFDMTSVDGVNWTTNITTADANSPTPNSGGIKFRADHDWTTSWGSADFPDGTGVTANGVNIQCTAGNWDVTFNSTTGEYHFTSAAQIQTVKLVGPATSADVNFSTLDGVHYTASNVTLLTGNAFFNVEGANVTTSGGFPTGVAGDPADLPIPVVAGTYSSITLDLLSGDYSFTAAPVYPIISLIGSGTTGTNAGWNNDFVDLTTTDGITYTAHGIRLYSVNSESADPGAVKFRQNHDWSTSYGGVTFPTGPQVGSENDNILVSDGTWDVTFNLTTKAYTFSFPSISLVGPAVGGWPGDPGNPGPIDVIQLTTTDGENYSINNLVIVDGEAKFRLNNDWTTSWGDPSSTNGNIFLTAGTYNVTFTLSTGLYNFTALTTKSFTKAGFKVYPNPTQNNWNFFSAKGAIQSVQIIDMLGKTVMTIAPADTNAIVDASSLNAGIYFAKVSTAAATETVKLVKN